MTLRPTLNPELSRRGVLFGLGGLSVCLAVGPSARALAAGGEAAARPVSAWIDISPDGAVRLYSAGAEMGQGSLTSLAAILAEELDADWSRVTVEFAPSDGATYGYRRGDSRSMAIVGSRAVMMYFDQLREAGAQVRKLLVNRAAEHWGADAATLRTEPHAVVDPASGRRMGYGEIVALGGFPESLPEVAEADMKPRSAYRLVGGDVPRVDVPLKVNGAATFALDVTLPGMVHATTVHSPVQGGEALGWNAAEVEALPGVIGTVKVPNGVAIVAEKLPQALDARWTLVVDWSEAPAKAFDSVAALDRDYMPVLENADAERKVTDSGGDVEAAFASAAATRRAVFKSDLSYHAQMEPLNAIARFNPTGDAVEVWNGTQAPDRSREEIAEALGLPLEAVTIHQCYMGGGFGRRSLGDYAVEAALVAREVGRPVKMVWTREEDIANGMFRPQNLQCVEAALDETGKVRGFRHCVIGDGGPGLQTSGAGMIFYDVPDWSVELRGLSHGVRLKHWRAVAHVANMFAQESFIDELAHEAGMDPIAFRVERMGMAPRSRAAFERLAAMVDLNAAPAGRARGVSATERSGSLGAGAVELSLDRDSGRIRVHKVWMAVDAGLIVAPDAARANVESGVIYGLSGVLKERATVTGGRVDQTNFHDYEVLRMSEAPESIEVAFIDSPNPPSGIGEIGTPWLGAAVANAVFAMTGRRLRHSPFTPDRVRQALAG